MRPAWPEARHGRALALLVVGVLLLHGLLLGGLDLPGSPRVVPLPSAVQVRRIVAPPVAAADEPVKPAATPAAGPAPQRPQRSIGRPRAAAPKPTLASPTPAAASPVPERSASIETATTSSARAEIDASAPVNPAEAAAPAASAAATATSAPADTTWPVYATRMPPPVTLHYDLRRGALSGSGELQWRPEGERYSLQLLGSVLGLNVITQVSQGGLDAAGVAPQRFTDQRLRRSVQAANFQREAGKITFSGPGIELPLAPGVQDRLSWMIQLAAVAAAEPARWVAGTRITLQVVGARGDAGTWTFRSLGLAALDLAGGPAAPDAAGGPIETLHFLSEPRGPYETRVEVWLDPQRHHLPVQATLGSAEGENLELRLRELVPGP
jgi:hypothetical protein